MNNLDFKNTIKLAENVNTWTQWSLNIIYQTIAVILLVAILVPALSYFTKKMFGAKAEPSGLLKNWISVFASILVVAICYAIITSINLLLIKPEIETLKDAANVSTDDFSTAVTTSGFVIANIFFCNHWNCSTFLCNNIHNMTCKKIFRRCCFCCRLIQNLNN
ncbi:hypothetical protein [Mesoplasma melaleucae]|uniref:Uncharacterized protein n=1 Tax=Mesoplasma melaleucae TaxID=81459 RepID=A0A2K8NWX0_9MOLU|nr:hypothetical protein [Mesoplasma melaleucae]ATZ18330.1 hypothetical protein EMELA_v1c08460 [Mesoplasma melaleucae]